MKKLSLYVILLILLDQISKMLISSKMIIGQTIKIIPNFLNFTYVQNTGAAFSILEGKQIILIIITIVVLIAVIYYLLRKKQWKLEEIIISSFLLSGIIGNLIDRILYQYVIDFISIQIGTYYFPIFNIADIFIVIGVIIYIIMLIKEDFNANICCRRK